VARLEAGRAAVLAPGMDDLAVGLDA